MIKRFFAWLTDLVFAIVDPRMSALGAMAEYRKLKADFLASTFEQQRESGKLQDRINRLEMRNAELESTIFDAKERNFELAQHLKEREAEIKVLQVSIDGMAAVVKTYEEHFARYVRENSSKFRDPPHGRDIGP